MASTSFIINEFTGDDTQVKVTLTDVNGSVEAKVEVLADPESNYIGDITGVFFHITETLVGTLKFNGTNGTVINGYTQEIDNVDKAENNSNISGNISDTPIKFDVGVGIGNVGAAPGDDVRIATFLISSSSGSISVWDFVNAEPGADNDFGVRLQTVGEESDPDREGSSKLIGDVPPPIEEPPVDEDGIANTPGFWKQTQHFQFWTEPYDPTDSFTGTFGVSSVPFTDSLIGALSAGGGGIYALARAGTAGLLNAASDEAGSGINYIIDEDALLLSVKEVSGDLTSLTSILNTLDIIDGGLSGGDGRISTTEVIGAVNDALTLGGSFDGKTGIEQVAIAFDSMNNMPSLEVGQF